MKIKHCSVCEYNNFGQLYFDGPPHLYCSHNKSYGIPNKDLNMRTGEKLDDFLDRMDELENKIIYNNLGWRIIWYPTSSDTKFNLIDENQHLFDEQLTGFPVWCPLKQEG